MIVCLDDNRAIGKNGDLCYHISDDMVHFKNTTLHNAVVMGRKTYESLKIQPLPQRLNIVITRDKSSIKPQGDLLVVESFDEARALIYQRDLNDKTFVIGGASIYEEFIDDVDEIYVTAVKGNLITDADAFFPEYKDNFQIESSEPFRQQGDLIYEFEIWKRKTEEAS